MFRNIWIIRSSILKKVLMLL